MALVTPCPTRWNSTYDAIFCFLKHYNNIEHVNALFVDIGLPRLTNEDIELLSEYMQVMQPLAAVLDIFQGEKDIVVGLGVVLPLLTKLKTQLSDQACQNLEAIRDRVIDSINRRYQLQLFIIIFYLTIEKISYLF